MLLKPGIENKEYPLMFDGVDKILHFCIFAMLGFIFHAAFPKIKITTYLYVVSSYGFLTEILQDEMKLGRSSEILDIVADLVGILFGYLFYKFMVRRYFTN